MVQIEDDVYTKMLKDADDNKALIHITRCICATIIGLIIFFFVGLPWVSIQLDNYKNDILLNNSVKQAEINVQIREIESKGLTTQEYLDWLKIKQVD